MIFLTTGQAAARLGVTVPTIKRWIRTGHLVALRTPGPRGHYRILEADFQRFTARLLLHESSRGATSR